MQPGLDRLSWPPLPLCNFPNVCARNIWQHRSPSSPYPSPSRWSYRGAARGLLHNKLRWDLLIIWLPTARPPRQRCPAHMPINLIPRRNLRKMRHMGRDHFKQHFNRITHQPIAGLMYKTYLNPTGNLVLRG